MASFDLILNIIDKHVSTHVGHRSKYSTSKENPPAHPGTNQQIKGWEWGHARWPGYEELSDYSYIPNLFDSGGNIPSRFYQSGFGYDTDLFLEKIAIEKRPDKNIWSPQILSGTYFIYDREWYLFSDQYITETLNFPTHGLGCRPKDIAPVFVRRFSRDEDTSELKIEKELTKTTDDPPTEDEFYLDVSNPDNISIKTTNLSLGTQTKTFTVTAGTRAIVLESFPVNITAIEADGVVKYDGTTFQTGWSADEDTGHIKLSEGHGATDVEVSYQETFSVQYEPYFSKGKVSAVTANVNPIHSGVNKGFVQITTEILEPYEITLNADLPIVSNGNKSYYNLELGNNTGKLIATVKNKVGTLLEGVKVYFDWGLTNDLSSITDHTGRAIMYYNSPATIEDIGDYVLQTDLDFTQDPVMFDVANVPQNTPLNNIWIFALYHTDPFFGLKDQTAIDQYYTNYITDEGSTYSADEQQAEESYRDVNFIDINNPARPRNISSMEESKKGGQKRLILKEISVAPYVNPNDGTAAALNNEVWWPVFPTSLTGSQVGYDSSDLPDATERQSINSYFIVSNQVQAIQAYAYNSAGEKIWSNTIEIQISLPDSVNGTYYSASLAEPYVSELLRGLFNLPSKSLDSEDNYQGFYPNQTTEDNTNPNFITLSQGNEVKIPIGFRIKTPNSGITVASLLEQVTFINPHGETEEPT